MISVCMATYNGAEYIREQLDSIIACVGPEDELVVSDDGSIDETLSILEGYSNIFPSLRVVEGPRRGLIANFSNALSEANGEYVFLSDQDDIWRSDKVSKVINAFKSVNCGVVVHDACLIDGDGQSLGTTLFSLRRSKSGLMKNMVKNSYVGCCMAIKSELLSSFLPIPENVEMHDWWIGLVSEVVSSPYFINDQLIDYRRHGGNASKMHHYSLPKMVSNRLVIGVELTKRVILLKAGGAQ